MLNENEKLNKLLQERIYNEDKMKVKLDSRDK